MKKTKTQKGITLVALIITIIVLLILAVVAIRAVQGDGIIRYAQNARDQYTDKAAEEEKQLKEYNDYLIESVTGVNPKLNPTGTIPEGGIYTASNGTVYNAGDNFPITVSTGDKYVYGDYEYAYNCFWGWDDMYIDQEWNENTSMNGYGVRVLNNSKTTYGQIMESINKYPIVSLENTFMYCSNLENAPAIPNGVTNMSHTFKSTSIKKAPIIPNSVTNMESTFDCCMNLEIAPKIPENVTNMNYTFRTCENLTTVPEKIPSGVTSMEGTFLNCPKITNSPILPEKLISMDQTFSECKNLKSAPEIPDSVTALGYTFEGCTKLTKAPKIPENVKAMPGTFEGCSNLESAPEIPDGVTEMSSTFSGCTNLTTAPSSIPNGVKSMNTVFKNCTKLTTVPEIPESVTMLIDAFYGCTLLEGDITVNTNNITKSTGYGAGSCESCFYGTTKNIKLIGSASETVKSLLASTASNGNVTY